MTTSGTLLGWGRDVEDELADGGTPTPQPAPLATGSALPAGSLFATIVAGNEQAMALTGAGTIVLWGTENVVALAAGPDTDNDGQPDSWELTYGLNPLNPHDVTADADGNGLPDYWENYYFGHTGVDPNAAVAWNSGLTLLQAFQQN